MLHKLAPDNHHIVIQAQDYVKGHTRQVFVSNIPQNSTATGGLPTTLTLTKRAKVMLTVNVDVCDGLVNGARGIVSGIIKNNDKVLTILVKFDDAAMGRATIQTSSYKFNYPDSVPILRHSVNFRNQRCRSYKEPIPLSSSLGNNTS